MIGLGAGGGEGARWPDWGVDGFKLIVHSHAAAVEMFNLH